MPTRMLCRRPASVRVPGGGSSSIAAVDVHVFAQPIESDSAPACPRRRSACAIGTSAGMRDPRAVVAVAHFAQLVGAHLGERGVVGGRIVLDRNLRRHAAHRVDAAAVAGLDEQLRRTRAGTALPSSPARDPAARSPGRSRSVLMELKM